MQALADLDPKRTAHRRGRVHQPRPARLLLAAAVLTGVAGLMDGTMAAAESTGAVACSPGRSWTTFPASATFGYGTELIVDGTRPAWLMGISAGARRPGRPLALRWANGAWRETAVPWRSKVSGIVGADGDRRSAWAVGFLRPGPSLRPLIGRWTGGRWVALDEGPLPDTGTTLVDVTGSATGRVMVVGTAYTGGRIRAVAARREGGRWLRVDPPTGTALSGFVGVTSDPSGRPWAVGWRDRDGQVRPMVARWFDGGWSVGPGATLPEGAAALTDVVVRAAGEAYAVGYHVDPRTEQHRPVLERWDGTSWSVEPTPWAGGRSMVPRAVAVSDQGDVAIAGQVLSRNTLRESAFIAHRVDGAWTFEEIGAQRDNHWEMLDVATIGGHALAVGGLSNKLKAFALCGGSAEARRAAAASATIRSEPVAPRTPVRAARTAVRVPHRAAGAPTPTGSVVFRDVAARADVAGTRSTWGGATADFNDDGWPDLVINRHTSGRPLFLRGGRGGFRAFDARLPKRDYHGCDAADVDRDGLPDLLCTLGANHGYITKANMLWRHPGRGRPDSSATDWGIMDPFARGRSVTFLNLDGDRYPDVYLTTELERIDGLPTVNRLFRDRGGAGFVAAPQAGVDLPMGGRCATGGDLDRDGDDELLVCATERSHGTARGLRVFRNNGGRLVHATRSMGLKPIGDQDVVVVDLDRDGWQDVVQLGRSELRISLGGRGGLALRHRMRVSSGVALGAGDADGDGDQDLYVVRAGRPNQRDLLLLNRGRGTRFTSARIPQARSGIADDVIVLDHDRNGTDDFLVLNGHESSGPTLLIAASRS